MIMIILIPNMNVSHHHLFTSILILLVASYMRIHQFQIHQVWIQSCDSTYANPNPSDPSLIAINIFSLNASSVKYSGRSNWLKHVCADGSRWDPYALWMLNRFTPSAPCKAWKPSRGTYIIEMKNMIFMTIIAIIIEINWLKKRIKRH